MQEARRGRGVGKGGRPGKRGGKGAAEGDDFREGSGAIRVGDVAALGGVHHVATTPEVVERIVHRDLGDAVLIGELDGAVDGAVGNRLSQFFVSIPAFRGREARW